MLPRNYSDQRLKLMNDFKDFFKFMLMILTAIFIVYLMAICSNRTSCKDITGTQGIRAEYRTTDQ